ncbi:MAG: serine/threonine-protein phosphatase [Myxococcales bacterium]|jgi:serine/threonine protein phosphatase PrpC|nr:MAG: serine/threonine-protein phosphatase [Myxococcales bacterium]
MISRPSTARRIESSHPYACGLTDVGLRRSRNEDEFFVGPCGQVLLVADGLGGLPAGDVASRTAIASASSRLCAAPGPEGADALGVRVAMMRAFGDAHLAIADRGMSDAKLRGMATTLVAALITQDRLFVAHVGDVRGYLGRAGRLLQLTADHSLVGEMVAAGQLTPEQARTHPSKNVVTQALGLGNVPVPSFKSTPIEVGDLVMLCSDGLWETMTAEELEQIVLAAGDLEQTSIALADRAIAAGGSDNITVVVYRHEG